MARRQQRQDPHLQAYQDGWAQVRDHQLFQTMDQYRRAGHGWVEDEELREGRGWLRIHPDGSITANKHARGTPSEWAWMISHAMLHLGFDHLDPGRSCDPASQAAACLAVTRFQQQLRLGDPPYPIPPALPGSDEQALAQLWQVTGVPEEFARLGSGGAAPDHTPGPAPTGQDGRPLSWSDLFAIGLAAAAAQAVESAGEARVRQVGEIDPDNPWEQARRWFVTTFPLLGALAAGFRIIADAELARSMQITIAAVNAESAEIYVNPLHPLSDGERRFVLAHEMLHAALRHGERVGPRDPYLWNVAADFVVNGWLVELAVGELPHGALYDPALKCRSVEDVYHEITKNLRRYRKLATLRGYGHGDLLSEQTSYAAVRAEGAGLDDFYRRAMLGGRRLHEQAGRGLLPSGLEQEIRVLEHPPPPWDVQLAEWFDRYFSPLERIRSYARPSRRQASTPDIPRPGRLRPDIPVRERTFGVVLDTSGSMNSRMLGRALGAVASYAQARDVPAARVVFCDAVAYDSGYLPVEEIAGRVRVRGRGGTVLQPGINLLERAEDFPPDGPILIITDGQCDVLRVRRGHAFLIPRGARLPFTPRGDVFRLTAAG